MSDQIPCTKCFSALGISSRMAIYNHLIKTGGCTVSQLVRVAKLTQPTVSYHLREMKKVGLVTRKKMGKEVYYKISKKCPSVDSVCFLSSASFLKGKVSK